MVLALLPLVAFFVGLFILCRKLNIQHTWTKKVEKTSSRHGGELVAQVLQSHGIKYVFTLCGGHISPILVGCEHLGIKIIDTRHEVNAVFAADAVARLSGTVGVVAVTAGPGLTNTVTAIKNAQMAESPLLLMGGAAATLLKGRGALQDIDQMCLFKPLCKFTATISRVADIIPTLKKAMFMAQSGTPGPVFVEFPIDVLYPYKLVRKEAGIKDSPKGFMPKIVNWYISNNVDAIFAGAWEVVSTKPLKPSIPLPNQQHISTALHFLQAAKKPVALLGSQSTLPPVPVDKLKEALEGLGIPCFLGGMARGMLGRNSNIHIRQRRRDALAEADVVLLIACQADPSSFMCELFKQKKTLPDWSDWCEVLKAREIEKERVNKVKADETAGGYINPVRLLHELEDSLDANSIIVADGGDFVGTAAYILRPRAPLCWLDPGAFGTLGVGGGFALGAKLVRPEAEVWVVWGDGSCAYSIAEYDTYKKFNLPVIGLIGNDGCWSQIAREQVPMFDSKVGCELRRTDYDKVVEGYGGVGLKLESNEIEKIYETFLKAKECAKSGNPVVINALIGTSDFRAGSISV